MAYTTINKQTDYFNTKLYTGTGAAQSLTGVGFQPDLTWIKPRSYADNNVLFDAVRGVTGRLISNDAGAQGTVANMITAFDSDGFSIGDNDNVSRNSETLVAWNWKANGAGSLNEVGSIDSTVSVNTTSGFSICKWSGSGANATIGHGLGVAPKMIITKSLGSSAWAVYNENLGNTNVLFLDTTAATSANIAYWNNTSPTSSVFSVGTDDAVNHSGNDMIAYCFAEKVGYSKFGQYTGNGNADGTFVYTGFKPSFVIFKRATTSGASWCIIDTVRQPYNTNTLEFPAANLTDAEATGSYQKDFLSNGFKMRSATDNFNKDGDTYIYMAFGQSLVGTNDIAATAK